MIKKLLYFFLAFFLLMITAVVFIFFGLYQIYTPLGGNRAETLTIEKGQGVKQIGVSLESKKLIRSSFWFETYVWLSERGNKLQAGDYSISAGQSIAQIGELISSGKIIVTDVWLTIPEGFTEKQIIARMGQNGLAAGNYLASTSASDFVENFNFFDGAPTGAGLEGFLFPDTYKFKPDNSGKEIVLKMLENFDEKLTLEMRADIKNQNRTIFEIVTMASIIEKEVITSSDRKIVAGIFWQRIKDGHPLESDATLSYIFEDKKDRHSSDETKVDSPYNTYKYSGLPPGPINNPGLDAIQAAIYPQESPYYYFLTKPDTGEAVFAKTLDEQNLNKAKYLK